MSKQTILGDFKLNDKVMIMGSEYEIREVRDKVMKCHCRKSGQTITYKKTQEIDQPIVKKPNKAAAPKAQSQKEPASEKKQAQPKNVDKAEKKPEIKN